MGSKTYSFEAAPRSVCRSRISITPALFSSFKPRKTVSRLTPTISPRAFVDGKQAWVSPLAKLASAMYTRLARQLSRKRSSERLYQAKSPFRVSRILSCKRGSPVRRNSRHSRRKVRGAGDGEVSGS